MKGRETAGRLLLAFLVVLSAGVPAALAIRALVGTFPRAALLLELRDGTRLVGEPLGAEGDAFPRYLTGGADPAAPRVRAIDPREIVLSRPATGFWRLEREDGPLLFVRPEALRLPDGRFLPGDPGSRLSALPRALRTERAGLVRALREAEDPSGPAAEWARWSRRDAATLLIGRDAAGRSVVLRLSGLTSARPASSAGWAGRLGEWTVEWRRILSQAPGAWDGGGLRPALLSLLLLLATTGTVAAGLGIPTAVYLHEYAGDEPFFRIVSRVLSGMAGVPGVVWGAVGLGLLVQGAGGWLDRGGELRWAAGGVLWSALALGGLAAPVVVVRARNALEDVPRAWRDLARTSGASRWQVLSFVVLPSAARGLAAAAVAGMARVAGETAPLLLTGALRALGGDTLEGTGVAWDGGFLHPGVLALQPPWSELEAEQGYPLAWASLLLLSALCVALELLSRRLGRRPTGDAP